MKYPCLLLFLAFLFPATSVSQNYTFRYNPYTGMNQDQLELALEQARKMERSGKIWTAVGSGMLAGGAIMTFRGIENLSSSESFSYGNFGTGLVVMCFSSIPLGYGIFAWITGHERANMIEIELLAFEGARLHLKPSGLGIGLVMNF